MSSPRGAHLPLLLLASGLPGCLGDQFGGETTPGGCIVVSRETVELDEVTPIGFRAFDVLDFAARSFELPFSLSVSEEDAPGVSVTPEGDTTLEFDVVISSTTAIFVDAEVGTESSPGVDCLDYVEVDTEVTLRADNGAFDDTLPGTLRAHHPGQAQLEIDFSPGDLQGSFDMTGDEDLGELVEAPLRFTISPGNVWGDLGAYYREPGQQEISTYVPLWRTADDDVGACYEEDFGGPIDDGMAITRLQTLLAGTPRLAVAFTSGDATDVELEVEFVLDGSFCLIPADVPGLSVSGKMVLTRASDGSPFVTWPMQAYARYTQDGQFRDFHVNGGLELALPFDEAEGIEAFGDFGFDFSELQQWLAATWIWLEHDGSGAWEGDLRIEADQDYLADAIVTELE